MNTNGGSGFSAWILGVVAALVLVLAGVWLYDRAKTETAGDVPEVETAVLPQDDAVGAEPDPAPATDAATDAAPDAAPEPTPEPEAAPALEDDPAPDTTDGADATAGQAASGDANTQDAAADAPAESGSAEGEVAQGEDADVAGADPDAREPSQPVEAAKAERRDASLRLDEIRVEDDGLAVIAGRATPGADVILRADGIEVARATAGADGAFATVAMLSASDGPRVLSLAELGADGGERLSQDELILAPIAAPAVAAAGADDIEDVATAALAPSGDPVPPATQDTTESQTATDGAAENTASGAEPAATGADAAGDAGAAGAPAPDADQATKTAQADAADDSPTPSDKGTDTDIAGTGATGSEPQSTDADIAQSEPAASSDTAATATEGSGQAEATSAITPAPTTQGVAILRSDETGVALAQGAGPAAAQIDQVALDTIGYSALGDVQLSGRAQPATRQVRVYLDNQPVASLDVDAGGGWRGAVPDVDTGVYTLRIDEVGADGAITSRVETPFKREDPTVLAAATNTQGAKVQAVTVQKGDTLWAISRERYGEGLLYVRVFEANRSLIRDPDLIYPGQVFALPDD